MTATRDPATDLSNKELAEAIQASQRRAAWWQNNAGRLEQEAHRRLDANEAQVLTDDNGEIIVERKPKGSPEYDQGLLRAIIEAPGFNDEAYQECWKEAYNKPVETVAAHWDMVKIKKWANKLGTPVQVILDRARLPQRAGKLTFPDGGNDA